MTLTKEEKRVKSLLTMALRCEYVEGLTLTKKGWGKLTAKQWRLFNKIKGFLFPHYKKSMIAFLNDVDRIYKIEQLREK